MFPFVIFAALAGAIVALSRLGRDRDDGALTRVDGTVGESVPVSTFYIPPALAQPWPPLPPELVRFLVLMLLWAKDKQYDPGYKRYLSQPLAIEAHALALKYGLRGTARSIQFDAPLPRNELFPGRPMTVAEAILAFARTGKV